MEQLVQDIIRLKEERNAIILAHNYQEAAIQDIADYVGDSFGLSREAAATDRDVIVFCGVHFMAESAYILAPQKTVILPDKYAGCPLANTIDVEKLREKKKQYPDAAVVCYVNASAAVKAESDICCTSSNALQVVESIAAEKILFVPDQNLAHWVAQNTSKEIIPWDGFCITHHRVEREHVSQVRQAMPDAPVLVHPECQPEVVEQADFVGSTSAILKRAKELDCKKIIIGTEMGIIHRLRQENPEKEFYLLSPGLVCINMKKTNLQKLYEALETLSPQITVEEEIRLKAKEALDRMLQVC